jgi:hypothetical protein
VTQKVRKVERDDGGCQQRERDEDDSASLTPAPLLPTFPPGDSCPPAWLGSRVRRSRRGARRFRRRAFALRAFVVVEKILERLERVDVREGKPRLRVGVRFTYARLVDDLAPSFGGRPI